MYIHKSISPEDNTKMATSLKDLPDEIILQMISVLPATSIPSVEQTCKALMRLAREPTIWRSLCRASYRFWNSSAEVRERFVEPIGAFDWKKLFVMRFTKSRHIVDQIDSILSEQHGRIAKFNEIARCGYEAKDTLLEQISTKNQHDDGLCRTYYCKAVLGHIQRGLAIKEWYNMISQDSRDYDHLDKVLSAFDMFVIEDNKGDFDQIQTRLGNIVQDILDNVENFQELSIRAKSLAIVRYLQANGFNGVTAERYYDIKNNFIGIALHHKEHQCLPLISVSIFCAVARRLGLDARPCGFPFHVHAIVQGASNQSLDGENTKTNGDGSIERMYLDPTRSSNEVTIVSLKAQLGAMGIDASTSSVYLLDSPVTEIAHRAARNIAAAVKELDESMANRNPNSVEPPPDSYPSRKDAFYSALWASVVLESTAIGRTPIADVVRPQQWVNHLLFELSAHFPCDISLVRDHVVPFFRGFQEHSQLIEIINAMESTDRIQKEVKSRKLLDKEGTVKYRVGQIFKHRRYDYLAIITGWDRNCAQGEDWIQQMQVDALPNGRNQSFYHVLSWDNTIRYVAEINIQIETQGCPEALLRVAGKHFKRWDQESMRFISNMRDEYPED